MSDHENTETTCSLIRQSQNRYSYVFKKYFF